MTRQLSLTAGALGRAWAATIRHLRELNPPEDLAKRLHAADPIRGLADAFGAFAAAEHNAYAAAGQAEARWAAGETSSRQAVTKKLLSFDPADPDVMSWAERNRLDLVRDLTFEQRSLVRAMLIRIDEDGTNPLEAAREIYDAIGLTPAQEAAVQSYRLALERGEYAAALQRELSSGVSDRVISAAARRGGRLTQEQIDTAVERYRANYHVLRAETIARTESQRIAHQGSDALYGQAIRRGDLAADQLECGWLHSPGAKRVQYERAFHRVMHGQTRAWGEPFVSGLGNKLMFPGDPDAPPEETINCRCARTVRIKAPARVAEAA